jgi:hypothetical protein
MATRVIGMGARVSVPLLGTTLQAAEGRASVAATLFGAEVTAVFLEAPRVRLAANAGVAVAWLRTSGFATAPYIGQADAGVTGLPSLGIEVDPRLGERVHGHLGGDVALALPPADIAFANRKVASWGRPLGICAAGVSVDF